MDTLILIGTCVVISVIGLLTAVMFILIACYAFKDVTKDEDYDNPKPRHFEED